MRFRTRGSRWLLVPAFALLAALIVVAVGAGATPKKRTAPAVNVDQNLQQLYQAAKAEGSVTWQVSTTPANYAGLVSAFQAKYPGINVNLINVAGPELAGRMITEAQAGKLSFDLGTGRPDTISSVIQRKLVAAPRWTLYGVPQSKITMGGYLVHTYDFVVAPVYNTNMYKLSQLPTSWNDLLKPQWSNGKLIVDGQPTEGWESLLLGAKGMKLHDYANFVTKVYGQKPIVLPQSANVLNGVAQGQAGLGLAVLSNVVGLVAQGAPLAVDPITPVLAIPSGIFVPKGAAHPNAARLLGAFLGQASTASTWAAGGWTSAYDGSQGLGKLLADAGVKASGIAYINTQAELKKVLAGIAINQQDLHLGS